MTNDAIRVLLRLLVERPNDAGVRRSLAEVTLPRPPAAILRTPSESRLLWLL